jgi:hypothetical protein
MCTHNTGRYVADTTHPKIGCGSRCR